MKKKISTDQAPRAEAILSQAIVSNGNIYVAGQIHSDPQGNVTQGSTADKLAQIMRNISEILKAADAGLDDVVKVVVYITDMSLMQELNQAYPNYFKPPFPAREAVCVQALPLGASIEVSVIASKS